MFKVGDRVRLKSGCTNDGQYWSRFSIEADKNRTVLIIREEIDTGYKVQGFSGSYREHLLEKVKPTIILR